MNEFRPQPLPHGLSIADDEVHVWLVSLRSNQESLKWLSSTLSSDENNRAGKFHFQKDKQDYCVCRGTLRIILGSYLQQDPGSLSFRYNEYGKPFLTEHKANDLRFNLSHSRGMALYCFAKKRRIGIDLEYIRPNIVPTLINEHVFSARELKILAQLQPEIQTQAFFNGWTRKEAFIKALGKGIQIPMHQFEVSFMPDEPPRLLHTDWSETEPGRWEILDLNPGLDFCAALALEGPHWRLRCWTSPDIAP